MVAGNTPVLIHNCGNRAHDMARGAEGVDEMTATFERFHNRSDIYSETYGNGFEFWAPYGRRQVDIAIRNDSGGLDLYEVKVNKSNYTRGQRRKDEWLERTMVSRRQSSVVVRNVRSVRRSSPRMAS